LTVTNVGDGIKKRGWRQGSILRSDDLERLIPEAAAADSALTAIVISHSCDLTHHSLSDEPHVQIVIGHETSLANDTSRRGNLTHAKNPRTLCLAIGHHPEEENWIELSIHAVHQLRRDDLLGIKPDHDRFLDNPSLRILTSWLAERYRRAAFPDRFNHLLSRKRGKLKKLHKRLSPQISAIYVHLFPDRDTEEGENYSLNILATLPETHAQYLEEVQQTFNELVSELTSVGIDILASAVRLEDQVSISTIRDMKKLPLDYLSLAAGTAHPTPAVEAIFANSESPEYPEPGNLTPDS